MSKQDLTRTTLVTKTSNIVSMAWVYPVNDKINRVVFVGNFLYPNNLSMKLLI